MIEQYILQEKFDTLKFKRTYIGGNKLNEKKKIDTVLKEPDNNGIYVDADYYDLIDITHTIYTDKIHINYSWRKRLEEFKVVFMILSLISVALYNSASLLSQVLLISSVSLFILFQIVDTVLYLQKKKFKYIHNSAIALSVLHIKNPNKYLYDF